MAKRFSQRNIFKRHSMYTECDADSTEDDGYLPDLVDNSHKSTTKVQRTDVTKSALSPALKSSRKSNLQDSGPVIGKRKISSLSRSDDDSVSITEVKPSKQKRKTSLHNQSTSVNVSDSSKDKLLNNQRGSLSDQQQSTSANVSLSSYKTNGKKSTPVSQRNKRRAQLRAQLRFVPPDVEIINLDSDSDDTIILEIEQNSSNGNVSIPLVASSAQTLPNDEKDIFSKSAGYSEHVKNNGTSNKRALKYVTTHSTASKDICSTVAPMQKGDCNSTQKHAISSKLDTNKTQDTRKNGVKCSANKPSTSDIQTKSQPVKNSSTSENNTNSYSNCSPSERIRKTKPNCSNSTSSVTELRDYNNDEVSEDSNNPIIYEKGQPVRINPQLNTANFEPRFKRLLQQKTPVLKKVQDLTDVSQFHYVMLDKQGKISKDNDSLAQFVIDIGIIIKNAGKTLMKDGMKLQKEINEMREQQLLELKQEVSSEGGDQDVLDLDEDINYQPTSKLTQKHCKSVSEKSAKSLPKDKVKGANVQSVSNMKPGRQQRRSLPETVEERLKNRHVCQLCGDSFSNAENLNTHLNHHSNSIIVCTDCYKPFYSQERHRKHKQAHLFGFQKCERCNVTFDTLKALRAHVKRYVDEKYLCTIPKCKLGFKDKHNWEIHIQFGHLDERTVPCDICEKFYKTPNVVRSHKSRDHKDKKAVPHAKKSKRK